MTEAKHRTPSGFTPALMFSIILACCLTPSTPGQTTRDVQHDRSRATAVHRIPLFHAEKEKISLKDDPLLPFSTRMTCGPCHDYEKIRTGLHFNAADPAVPPGRPGEPWILLHRTTGTQVPLSYRPWPGTYRPGDVGLDPLLFTRAFGSHLPGGGISEPPKTGKGIRTRWWVTGRLEINCLLCHSADAAQNGSEWAVQVSRQNFLWAAAAASDMAVVEGSTAGVPDSYDPFMESGPDARGPRIHYDRNRFNRRGEVFFNLVRRAEPGRCYFCHSVRVVGSGAPAPWTRDRDVHLVKGLACTDCHRNGLDHNMVRGHEGEKSGSNHPAAALTCRGCHLGEGDVRGGRLAAPVPKHEGLPPVHLENLTCTACHSGPRPAPWAFRIQTSAAHRMGVQGGYRGEDAPPYIHSPVFKRQADGVIAPHRVMWPSFWGVLNEGGVVPLSPFEVLEAAGKFFEPEKKQEAGAGEDGDIAWTREMVATVLKTLATGKGRDGEPVFASGGRLYRLEDKGTVSGAEHPAAAAYAWPLAHDVRPASRALGAGGCTDCHAADAPFHFGRVRAVTPGALEDPVVKVMHEFQGLDPLYLRTLGASFQGQTVFQWIGITASAVLVLVLILYGFQGLGRLLRRNRR